MRALLLAEAANPEWTSVPLVGFNQCEALREQMDVHVVTQVRNREALLRRGWREGPDADFTAINSEPVAKPMHRVAKVMGLGSGRAWSLSTGLQSIAYLYYERVVWRTFADRLRAGEFAAVHRITPVSPATPSPIVAHLARINVPFVLGPLNGGLSWPSGFARERLREGEIWSGLRGLRRLLPGAKRTLRLATRILVGSASAMSELPRSVRDKAIAMPENGIHADNYPEPVRGPSRESRGPLRFTFAGRLVPCKGLELGIEALLPLLRAGKATLTIYGDGPERKRLEQQAAAAGSTADGPLPAQAIEFAGWLEQPQLLARMRDSDVFLFPSIREFGGGALVEAMACGLYPIVVDYGGPPEICADAGARIPLGPRESIVAGLRECAERLCEDPTQLDELGHTAWRRAMTFSWASKAATYESLYRELRAGRGSAPAIAPGHAQP
ncbi:MAG: glycosyltransferase family 4 protein [Planctomycetota bacterium]